MFRLIQRILKGTSSLLDESLRVGVVFAVFALASLARADEYGDRVLRFSTAGTDRYADGTIVPDGECYALVWSPAGKSFSGFNADGTAASPLDRVVLAGPLALEGRCRDTLFQIPEDTYAGLEGGNWAVCLIDTRRANGVPAGVRDGKPLRVNRWGIVTGGVTIKPASASNFAAALSMGEKRPRASLAASTPGGVRAANLSKVPSDAQAPTITAMDLSDGIVTLSVADTVPYLTYTIESGFRLNTFAIDGQADKVDGNANSEIVLETESISPSCFFRVIRAE